MIKSYLKNIIALILILLISSCSKNNDSIKNRYGDNIVLPESINKVVSLSPAITEILIDLQVSDKIIACDPYSKDILIKNNGKYTNLITFDLVAPDAEKIISLNTDIVLVNSLSLFSGEESLDNLKNMGLCVIVIPYSKSISDIEDDILFISSIFKKDKEGRHIADNMNANIEKIKLISNSITNKKRVYFEIASLPSFYSFGTNVFLNEMIEIIGAENIFKDRDSWLNVSEESIIYENPDTILTSVNYIENPENEILNREAWKNINAVKNRQVYYIDTDSSTLANHNITKALIQMAKSVYSNEYADFKF
ncbi:ABC transporter substrate-binding protein [Brachyspira alvinipulli]|uniref:ABC transporter substrate-binding protein n=1 Tax=Brachyspira alvinipulli TaxID=84379 RepID=UPI000482C014|nr:ABC transporter substrate-binding protein [Brachyspira alvinipulli]